MVVANVIRLFLVRHQVGDAFEQEIQIIRAENGVVGKPADVPGIDRRQSLTKNFGLQVVAPTERKSAYAPASFVKDNGRIGVIELVMMRTRVGPRSQHPLFFAAAQHEPYGPLGPQPAEMNIPSRLDDQRRVASVV